MTTPNINLKSLEFNDIKTELITYIKSKSDFSDFDFEGSALSTIIDLMTYNTFYQLMFQNILVNEMFIDSAQKLESLISHAKIQGFVVPGKRSSTATIKVSSSTEGTIPAYTRFQGRKSNAEVRLFYNLTEQQLTSTGSNFSATFDVYEASRFVNGAALPFDSTSQSSFIPEIDVDFRTVKVEVDIADGNGFSPYTVATSVEPTSSSNQNICFIERRETGYDIMFSGVYDPLDGTFRTSELPSNTTVKVTYAVASGLAGNGSSSFSFAGVSPVTSPEIVSLSGLSSRGTNAPSIENLKFNIPRVFSAQSRVVTKDDVKSFLIEEGFATTFSQITVEGGEEREPLELGNVFFRVLIDGSDITTEQQTLAQTLLGEKSISGISYTYDISIGGGS